MDFVAYLYVILLASVSILLFVTYLLVNEHCIENNEGSQINKTSKCSMNTIFEEELSASKNLLYVSPHKAGTQDPFYVMVAKNKNEGICPCDVSTGQDDDSLNESNTTDSISDESNIEADSLEEEKEDSLEEEEEEEDDELSLNKTYSISLSWAQSTENVNQNMAKSKTLSFSQSCQKLAYPPITIAQQSRRAVQNNSVTFQNSSPCSEKRYMPAVNATVPLNKGNSTARSIISKQKPVCFKQPLSYTTNRPRSTATSRCFDRSCPYSVHTSRTTSTCRSPRSGEYYDMSQYANAYQTYNKSYPQAGISARLSRRGQCNNTSNYLVRYQTYAQPPLGSKSPPPTTTSVYRKKMQNYIRNTGAQPYIKDTSLRNYTAFKNRLLYSIPYCPQSTNRPLSAKTCLTKNRNEGKCSSTILSRSPNYELTRSWSKTITTPNKTSNIRIKAYQADMDAERDDTNEFRTCSDESVENNTSQFLYGHSTLHHNSGERLPHSCCTSRNDNNFHRMQSQKQCDISEIRKNATYTVCPSSSISRCDTGTIDDDGLLESTIEPKSINLNIKTDCSRRFPPKVSFRISGQSINLENDDNYNNIEYSIQNDSQCSRTHSSKISMKKKCSYSSCESNEHRNFNKPKSSMSIKITEENKQPLTINVEDSVNFTFGNDCPQKSKGSLSKTPATACKCSSRDLVSSSKSSRCPHKTVLKDLSERVQAFLQHTRNMSANRDRSVSNYERAKKTCDDLQTNSRKNISIRIKNSDSQCSVKSDKCESNNFLLNPNSNLKIALHRRVSEFNTNVSDRQQNKHQIPYDSKPAHNSSRSISCHSHKTHKSAECISAGRPSQVTVTISRRPKSCPQNPYQANISHVLRQNRAKNTTPKIYSRILNSSRTISAQSSVRQYQTDSKKYSHGLKTSDWCNYNNSHSSKINLTTPDMKVNIKYRARSVPANSIRSSTNWH